MSFSIILILILGVVLSTISVWWVATTLKEGRKAMEESQDKI
tara:strand:+ start:239 stop:364 length:126 start_codon:yes stop_codon:yes gene_type:complete